MDNIEYTGKSYPAKTVSVPSFGDRLISVESLGDELFKDGKYTDNAAKVIDEEIFFYVPDAAFDRYTDEQLGTYVWIHIGDRDDVEDVYIEGEWECTDDLQRGRMLIPGTYELIEANYVDGKYLISEPDIVDTYDYVSDDGTYSEEARNIISSYYHDADGFDASCSDMEFKRQLLAEMVYEQRNG